MSFNINIKCQNGQTTIQTKGQGNVTIKQYNYPQFNQIQICNDSMENSFFQSSDESQFNNSFFNNNSDDEEEENQNSYTSNYEQESSAELDENKYFEEHYRKQIQNLPLEKFKNSYPEKVCSVCLNNYNQKDILKRLPCMHYFHEQCCDDWLYKSPDCPICRSSIF